MENGVKDKKTEDLRVKKKILNFLSQRSQQNKIPLWLQTPYQRQEKQRRAGHIHSKTISRVWSYNARALLNESCAQEHPAAHTAARLAIGSHLGAWTVGTLPLSWPMRVALCPGRGHTPCGSCRTPARLLCFSMCLAEHPHDQPHRNHGCWPCDLPVGHLMCSHSLVLWEITSALGDPRREDSGSSCLVSSGLDPICLLPLLILLEWVIAMRITRCQFL